MATAINFITTSSLACLTPPLAPIAYTKFGDRIDLDNSRLNSVTSENNCFIVADAGFQFVARYLPAPNPVAHYDVTEARELFGFDLLSEVIVSRDEAAIFVDPSSTNYALQDSVDCGAVAHTALP